MGLGTVFPKLPAIPSQQGSAHCYKLMVEVEKSNPFPQPAGDETRDTKKDVTNPSHR